MAVEAGGEITSGGEHEHRNSTVEHLETEVLVLPEAQRFL